MQAFTSKDLESNQSRTKKPAVQTDSIHIDFNRAADQISQQIQGINVVFPFEPYDCQKKYMASVIKSLNQKENSLIQCPTGTGKTLSLLCSTLAWVHNNKTKNPSSTIKIIYTSRTHSQLKQVIKQLKKTVYCPSLVIASSRDYSCCNSQLKHLDGHMKELECRKRVGHVDGKSCKYSKDESIYIKIKQEIPNKIMDIEQLVEYGKERYFCSFYYSRKVKESCNLILMPYNYLFDRNVARMYNIECKDTIVIIDEGHNVSYNAEQGFSAKITSNILYSAIEQLSALKQLLLNCGTNPPSKKPQKHTMEFKSNVEIVQKYIQPLISLHKYFKENYLFMFQNNTNQIEDGAIIQAGKFIAHVLKGTAGSKSRFNLDTGYLEYESIGASIFADMSYLSSWALESWKDFLKKLYIIRQSNEDAQSKFKVALDIDGENLKIDVLCLDPAALFQELKKEHPYNFIVTSGTLSPINLWEKQLGVSFPVPLALPNMIREDQLIAYTIHKGLNGKILDFNYGNRDNATLFMDLGYTMLQLIKNIPNGILILFSSYALLQTFRKTTRNTNYMGDLWNKKDVFFESKDPTAFKSDLDKYIACSKTPKGAVFFAVNRGKISQGSDLDADKCRAVILVGVPYLSIKDKKTKAKKSYLDSLIGKGDAITGNQWYMAQTIRNINQSVGRAIRNSKDYAGIYLIDSRFSQKDIIQNVSDWVRSRIVSKTNVPIKDIIQETKSFFVNKNHEQVKRIKEIPVSSDVQQPNTLNPLAQEIKSVKLSKCRLSQSISTSLNEFNCQKANQTNQVLQLLKIKVRADDKAHIPKQELDTGIKIKEFKKRMANQAEKNIFARKPLPIQHPVAPKPKIPEPQQAEKGQQKVQDDSTCSICTVKKELVGNQACSHKFCQDCWNTWLLTDLRCPNCRERVRLSYLLRPESEVNK